MEVEGIEFLEKELNDFFKESPIVVYKPYFSEIFGSVVAGLLASNLIYWAKRVKWREFYKTDNELCEELGCGFDALRTAKKKLMLSTDVFKTENKGLPRKTYYSVNISKLVSTIEKRGRRYQYVDFPHSSLRECSPECGDPTDQSVDFPHSVWVDSQDLNAVSPHSIKTSTTTSTTTSNTTTRDISSNTTHTHTYRGIGASPPSEILENVQPFTKEKSFQLNDNEFEFSPDNDFKAQGDVKKENPPLRPKKVKKTSPEASISEIEAIFVYWKEVMNHPNAKMDEKRRKLISEALKLGYDSDNLKMAILGCYRTPFNMGENDRSQIYDGLHIIFRGADSIDRFCKNALNPPRILTESQKLTGDILNSGLKWLGKIKVRDNGVNGNEAQY